MPQPIFYFGRLNLWDKISIATYLIVTVVLGYFFLNVNSDSSNRTLLLGYALGTQLFLYLLNYQSLRNLTVYLIWVLFAIGHLYFYFKLKDNPELLNVHGHATTGLKNTIILLALFQLLRFISLKIQAQELVAPTRGGRADIFENRRLTFVDYTLFIVYLGVVTILNI